MNSELDNFEDELRGLRPAQPPADLVARLSLAQRSIAPAPAAQPAARRGSLLFSIFNHLSSFLHRLAPPAAPARWLVPATAVALAVGLVLLNPLPAPAPALKADSVHLDQQLVGAFDAVGRLPTGEPVRFRYQQWMDDLVVRDKSRGVVIQQRTPRVEVIPVGFETY